MIIKEKLSDIKEEYEKAHKLIDEDSKNDPVTEPFRSHYAAKDILQKVSVNLKSILSDSADSAAVIFKAILGHVLKDIGRINIFTEDLSNGEIALLEALDLLQLHQDRAENANVTIETLNHLGILWSNRGDTSVSKEFLNQAEDLYKRVKSSETVPMTIDDLFGTKDEVEKGKGALLLEKNHTLTLYYIAQVHGHLGNLDKSAHYCHLTLKRQLEFKDYEPIDWALNAATLSQYYFPKNSFTQARHLLAAATLMLDNYETDVIEKETNEQIKSNKIETHKHRSADVFRCWAKFGIYILSTSKDRLCNEEEEEDQIASATEKLVLNKDVDRFEGLQLSVYEDIMADEFCLTFDDAKLIMLSVVSYLNKAKEYYTKETEASEYARIIQDISSVYKYLSFFDDDEGNQCKLLKRCADQLEELDALLNQTYYLVICREIWYELGLTYSKMLDIKLTVLETNDRPSPHALNKINILCEKSISKFQKFLESYKIDMDGLEMPDALDENDMKPILFAIFHIARLYYKIITPDKAMQLVKVQQSFKYYHTFVLNCEADKAVGNHFKAEIGVCKEMVKLLPLKIMSLQKELGIFKGN